MKYFLWFAIVSLTQLTAEAAPINNHCPVTPMDEIAHGVSINHEGREIGFCSVNCLNRFKASPVSYRANLPSPGMDQISTTASADHAAVAAHDHGETGHEHNEAAVNQSHSKADSTSEGVHEHGETKLGLGVTSVNQSHSATDSESEGEHDHATDHGEPNSSWMEKLETLLGKLHVLAVHLPIGLLSFAVVFELIGWWRGAALWSTVSRFNFIAGSFAALAAAPLGWLAAANANYPSELQDTLQVHRWLGVTTAVLALGGLFVLWLEKRSSSPRPTLYRILILLIAVIVPLTAHFGGSLIYGPNYLWSTF